MKSFSGDYHVLVLAWSAQKADSRPTECQSAIFDHYILASQEQSTLIQALRAIWNKQE